MMKKLKILMSSSIIALSFIIGSVSAAELDENMQVLAQGMNILQSSTDREKLLESLDIMAEAIDGSKKVLPKRLSPADKQGKEEYINKLNLLQKEITLLKEKVVSGQLSDISMHVTRMNEIRVEGHTKFR